MDSAIVSFNLALRTKLLLGPTSYNLADNPHYADAFSARHWDPAERRRQRAQQRGAPLAAADAVALADGDSSDDDVAAPALPPVRTRSAWDA